MYASAIIYKYEVQGTKSFEFTKFRFRPWDLYDNYDNTDDYILIRATAYNPKFTMPASSTFKLRINIAPIGGTLLINPIIGVSIFDQFEISLENCSDFELPL